MLLLKTILAGFSYIMTFKTLTCQNMTEHQTKRKERMDIPAVCLLLLECFLEDHTRDFIDLACLIHYPDHSLCVFYYTSLNEQSKVLEGDFQNILSGCW